MKLPFCSIIVLNYFGEKVLSNTIESVLHLDYPSDKYELIIVDNASRDRSKKIIKSHAKLYSHIKPLFLQKNLGFAGGNNEGIKIARGKYCILLNNDCIVNRDWLKNLIKPAEYDNKVFAVNSKILLFPKFLHVKLQLGSDINIEKALLTDSSILYYYTQKKALLHIQPQSNDIWIIEVPIEISKQFTKTGIDVCIKHPPQYRFKKKRDFRILEPFIDQKDIQQTRKKNMRVFSISIPSNIIKNQKLFDKIQNAGIVVFQNGGGRDIGAVVRYMHQDYEYDMGQYDKKREVYAACGAASLFRKKVLDKIGLLDKTFFMYYEDDEIAERARFAGYKTVYQPSAVVRHLHALSSGEWSPFFLYHAERGRLLHVLYGFPLYAFFSQYLIFILQSFGRLFLGTRNMKTLLQNMQRLRVWIILLVQLPFLLYKRGKKKKLHKKGAVQKNYKKILQGYWFFSKL